MPPGLMHAVLDALPDRIAVIDRSGRIVESNASWSGFADNRKHPLVPDTDRHYLDALTRSSNDQTAVIATHLQSLLDGNGRPESALTYHADEDGDPSHYVGFQQDVTDRKRAERDLETERDRLALLN